MRPGVARVREVVGEGGAGRASAGALSRANEKIDSLHGWGLDSIELDRSEVAALLVDALPKEASPYLDSVEVLPDAGRLVVRARMELTRIPAPVLGPLAGALQPSEWVTLAGSVRLTSPGRGAWRIEALSLRGVEFPVETSRRLVAAALPRAPDGELSLRFPEGVVALAPRREGGMVFRKETR